MKVKSKFICQSCGYESAGYLGKCPECGAWSSFVEEVSSKENSVNIPAIEDVYQPPATLNNITINSEIRTSTDISEVDRVLGGGIVEGSLTLLAGDPGIGKSTILLQISGKLCEKGQKILYVSSEESAGQIKLRAERIGIKSENLYIYSQTNYELIKKHILDLKPNLVIIDSIQAIYTTSIQSSAGSVSQIRECCNELMEIAKTKGISVIVIGHVTKEGTIAGPKVLEHMVDTVLQFEGDKYRSYRTLRSVKNRFGNTSEVGMFEMEEKGLREIINPSELFLKEYNMTQTPGSTIIVTNEGTRPMLVEIQALVGTTPYPAPRRITNGTDLSRVLQILAVLEKRVGLNLTKQDVYINVIGGIDVTEPAADLGIALAIITCVRDIVFDNSTVLAGEIGLSGEIRAVNQIDKRIKEAQKLGFKRIIIPDANEITEKYTEIEIIKVKKIIDALSKVLVK